jgi:hypothetical protein
MKTHTTQTGAGTSAAHTARYSRLLSIWLRLDRALRSIPADRSFDGKRRAFVSRQGRIVDALVEESGVA